ncbi:glycosyltransferase [Rhodonellum sp.]|uniref:glycosyltransferase family 2 protein n=1 Tax=Rhodonellum sp. TaxID=2231180 RepID=UPI00271CE309|nr:glycosyltransferase [Rhodonellum sp.]MDO9551118.1 glycosyltransferase [Rhodonellum sp.]
MKEKEEYKVLQSQTPMVSVAMITYGHEAYIKQAIEGVLMQQCDFELELIIANDCSPDNTDSVVQDILDNHPRGKWIKYTKHESNKGMMPNFVWSLGQCKGKYIAFCEGDDYWIDSLKLQKQVDFLEKNIEYVMCFTDRNILIMPSVKAEETSFLHQEREKSFTFKDIPFMSPTLTRVFKNIDLPKDNIIWNDTVHLTWISNYGKIMYLKEKTAVYRETGNGAWTSLNDLEKGKHLIITRLNSMKVAPRLLKFKLNLISSKMILRLWIENYPYSKSEITQIPMSKYLLLILEMDNIFMIKLLNFFICKTLNLYAFILKSKYI